MSALRVEIEALLNAAEAVEEQPGDMLGCRLDGRDVVLATAGIGKVSAALTVALLHQRLDLGLVIFTGVAGGLDPTRGIGDIVIGRRTIQHDAGLVTEDGLQRYQAGHLPFFNPTTELGYTPSKETIERTTKALEEFEPAPVGGRTPEVMWGTILTGDQFINDVAARDELFRTLGGAAVEMEGAAVAQVADRLGFDHLVIRSLSDLAGADSIDDFGRFLDEVAANSARLVRQLLGYL